MASGPSFLAPSSSLPIATCVEILGCKMRSGLFGGTAGYDVQATCIVGRERREGRCLGSWASHSGTGTRLPCDPLWGVVQAVTWVIYSLCAPLKPITEAAPPCLLLWFLKPSSHGFL